MAISLNHVTNNITTDSGSLSINGVVPSSGVALTGITGATNTALGVSALTGLTAGTNNTATGVQALYSNTTGSNNTAVGVQGIISTPSLTYKYYYINRVI